MLPCSRVLGEAKRKRQPLDMTAREKILEVLDAIRPAIQADGGDVELLAYREADGVVEVRLLGACESCPISMMTLREGIERRLKSTVPGIVEVTAL
jgi:Fe-S cluster biogenesis protein NfuA